MHHLERFEQETELIENYGKSKAHLIFSLGLFLDHPDLTQLASEGLTDGVEDKKIDFIRMEENKLVIAQGTYSDNNSYYKAKANKASDLNTALAWLFSGDLTKFRDDAEKFEISLQTIAKEIRESLENNEIEEINLLYVHNKAESQNVMDELETARSHLERILNNPNVTIKSWELGSGNLEKLFIVKEAAIAIKDDITLNSKKKFEESSEKWRAGVFTISGKWLKSLYEHYGDSLFSSNYRGFLGISRRGSKRINLGIKNTIEHEPQNFWAFNNGITILTTGFNEVGEKTILKGLSIINGAQTTGAIGHSDLSNIDDILILARIIESPDDETIDKIVEYNNTQNQITTWDKFSKDPEQKRIGKEFVTLGYEYSFKRGFENVNQDLSIEKVAQPSTALHGNFLEAGSGKNKIFQSKNLYEDAFKDIKAKHLLLAYCLVKAIDRIRTLLKERV